MTPADIRTVREAIAPVHWEGLFTPIGLKPTGNVPSVLAGSTGAGLSYDPERRILVRAVNRFATIVQLLSPRAGKGNSSHAGNRKCSIEPVIRPSVATSSSKFVDLNMLVMIGGRERTEAG